MRGKFSLPHVTGFMRFCRRSIIYPRLYCPRSRLFQCSLTRVRQFESMAAGHLQFSILDSDRDNSLFYSPVENPKHILDIGTGDATWAIECADEFPDSSFTLPFKILAITTFDTNLHQPRSMESISSLPRQNWCRRTVSSKWMILQKIGRGGLNLIWCIYVA